MEIVGYILFVLSGFTWLIGGNILNMSHYKRREMSIWSGLKLINKLKFPLPINNF